MADQLLFETSNESQVTSEPFISRQVVYVIDANNGNYSGQIQLDTSSLSNSGKYASYSEAYLQVPLVITMAGDATATFVGTPADATATASVFDQDLPFAVGLKNGFHHLIHSVSVEYNNTNVIQLTPYSNFDVQYKLMTSFSDEDIEKIGPTIGFSKDSSTSFARTTAGANVRTGVGIRNNDNYDAGTQSVATWPTYQASQYNTGFLDRQKSIAKQFQTQIVNPGPATVEANTTLGTFMTTANANSLGISNYRRIGVNHFWYVMATIRLKDMHDFFDKMCLAKGSYLRFIINVNTCQHTLTFNKSGAAAVNMTQESSTVAANGTSPLLVASGEANQGLARLFTAITAAAGVNSNTFGFNLGNVTTAVANGSYTARVALDIGKSSIANAGNFAWGAQTRLYVPLYTMNPINEEQYLSLNRTKKIVYRDIYQYRTDVGINGTFNALLTNGIPNPKTIILIPFVQGGSNPLNAAANGVYTDPFLSPFASEPGTTSPLIGLKDFNVQVAGVNMFIQNELYDFEQFINELSPQNAINGGLVDGMTSGLISREDFSTMYRYYVCDVSRRLPAEDSVPKSVQILGQSQSSLPISIFTFIEYERSVTLDLATGQLLQ